MPMLIISATVTAAVGAASSIAIAVLRPTIEYQLSSSTACYVAQGAAPVAVVGGAASTFVPAGIPYNISGAGGASLAVIQAAAGGFISITPVQE